MSLRIATFNAENLLRRFDFSGYRNQLRQDRVAQLFEIDKEAEYRQVEIARAVSLTDDTRQLTALAITEADADIVCLQEVEDLATLNAFEYAYLFKMAGAGYRHKFVVDGNDSRGIDVAVMMRETTRDGAPIEFVRMQSYAHVTYEAFGLYGPELRELSKPNDRVFKRDCLEIDVRVGGVPLTIYCVHFKSMGSPREGVDGRTWTMPVRQAEARALRRIITDRFGDHTRQKRFIICGDLNDYRERIVVGGDKRNGYTFTPVREEESSLDVLLADGFVENVVERCDEMERWTLYHTRGPQERHLCQLDYILLSPALARIGAQMKPEIVRAGQPWRTIFPPGQEVERYPRTGWDRPKASDHCPVVAEVLLT